MIDSPISDLKPEDLSAETGVSVESLQQWRRLRLIGSADERRFTSADVERVHLIQFCLRRGVTLQALARANDDEAFLQRHLEMLFPNGIPTKVSLAEVSTSTGIDVELIRRLWQAIGSGDAVEAIRADDVEMLAAWKIALDAGFPEEALLQVVRVYTDALDRVAEAEVRLFHFYVHERLKEAGLSAAELIQASQVSGDQMRKLIEPAILYFHRRGMTRAMLEDMILHLADDGAQAGDDAPAQVRLAIVFSDLASFTPLAEAMGDVAAAAVIDRFSTLVRGAVSDHHGRIVERIGDAFMLVFSDPSAAVAYALEIEKRSGAEVQFPAVRSGVHCGTVLYREGGYVGSNVNIASRVASAAERHQVLVTAPVRAAASGPLPDVEFTPVGKRAFKGVAEELELFEARARHGDRVDRVVDPVCGMELSAEEIAARLTLEGNERGFCSETCLRKFVGAPERYPTARSSPQS